MEAELEINEALGLGDGEIQDEPKPQEEASEEIQEEIQFSEIERSAMDQGWSKDRYEEDPSNSRSAKDYVEWGDMKSQIRNQNAQMQGMKKAHNEAMVNLNIFNKAQSEQRLTALKSELEKAVEDGNLEEVGRINDEQISIAKQADIAPVKAQAVDESDLMERWYDDNPWFMDISDPRTSFANSAHQRATNKGLVGSERLEFVNNAVTTQFTSAPKAKVNQNRNKASDYAGSNGAPKSRERKLTMDDIPADAMGMRELFETDEAFIKSYQNSQKGV